MNEGLLENNLSSEKLISILKSLNNFDKVYQSQVRHYTLEKHTLLVINEYKKYFSDIKLPISNSLFMVLLGLHDIGKPKAFAEGNRHKQHIYTVELINSIRGLLPFSDSEIDLCIAIVKADPIGRFMQNQITVEHAKVEIENLCKQTSLELNEFFKLMSIYYQSDTASYTIDAGGLAFLERLYLYQNKLKTFDKQNMRLKFSVSYENKYLELENALLK